jgi:hypothetical protein
LLDAETQQREALVAQREAGGGGAQELRQAMRALRTETDAAAQKVLDASQREAYEQMRREEGRGPRGRREATGGPQ